MPYVLLTKEAEAAVRSRADLVDVECEWPSARPDGKFDVWLSHEVLSTINASALGDEELSDTILRLCMLHGKKVN